MSEMEDKNAEETSTQSEVSEIKTCSPSRKSESSPQNSGAIPKTVTRSRSGGVKLGSFRLGGKKKPVTDSPDRNQDEKRTSKKVKKGKLRDADKPESEQRGENRHSIPSKATSLVRKLSIGKHRTASGKLTKSASGISSQEVSPVVSKTDISIEDDRFSTASSSTTGRQPSLDEGVAIATNNQTEAVDQSEISWSVDKMVKRSESGISEGFCELEGGTRSISQDTTLEDMHSLLRLQDKFDVGRSASSEFEEDDQGSIASYAPIIHSPPCIENEQLARLEILLSKGYSTKDQILQITAPALNKHSMEDVHARVPDVAQHGHNSLVSLLTSVVYF